MKHKIANIQGLRGIAAMAVVVYHAMDRTGGGFVVGQAGVDIFFVISGFIMWVVTRKPITPGEFLYDRIARIVPLYWGVTLIMALGSWGGLFPNLHASLLDLVRSLFFIPYQQDGQHAWPLLVAGWTLNYEMFFYVLFAALLLCGSRWRLPGLILVLAGLALAGWIAPSDNVLYRFYTDGIVLEFSFGILLAAVALKFKPPHKIVSGLLLGGGFATLALVGVLHPGGARVIEWGLPAFAIVAGAVWLEQAGVVLAPRWLVYIGSASYSLYLVHPLVISVTLRIVPHLPAVLKWPLLLGAPLAAGCLLYVIERQLTYQLRRKKIRPDDVAITTQVLPTE